MSDRFLLPDLAGHGNKAPALAPSAGTARPVPFSPEDGTGAPSFFEREASETWQAFERSVEAVRASFGHLAAVDIAHPPAGWPDARLARQIAWHLTVTQLGISRRRLIEELGKSRAAVAQALRVVDERLADQDFAAAYDAMAQAAREDDEGGR